MTINRTLLLDLDVILSMVASRTDLFSTEIGYALGTSYTQTTLSLNAAQTYSGAAVSNVLIISADQIVTLSVTLTPNTINNFSGRFFILGSALTNFSVTGTINNTNCNIIYS